METKITVLIICHNPDSNFTDEWYFPKWLRQITWELKYTWRICALLFTGTVKPQFTLWVSLRSALVILYLFLCYGPTVTHSWRTSYSVSKRESAAGMFLSMCVFLEAMQKLLGLCFISLPGRLLQIFPHTDTCTRTNTAQNFTDEQKHSQLSSVCLLFSISLSSHWLPSVVPRDSSSLLSSFPPLLGFILTCLVYKMSLKCFFFFFLS